MHKTYCILVKITQKFKNHNYQKHGSGIGVAKASSLEITALNDF